MTLRLLCAVALAGCALDTEPHEGMGTPDAVESTVKAGGTVSSDAEGVGPTTDAPVVTAVTTPNGGQIRVSAGPLDSESAPADYEFVAKQIEIKAPQGTAAIPLLIEFAIHESALPGDANELELELFRDRKLVNPSCTGAAGTASPDPCISERAHVGSELRLVARSSKASSWNFAIPRAQFDPSDKGTVDIGELQRREQPVTLAGNAATITLPFSTPVPGAKQLAYDAAVGEALTLVVLSGASADTVYLTRGTLGTGTPDKAGDWTIQLNGDRTEGKLTFYNEAPGDLELEAGVSYELQLTINSNAYLAPLPATTFAVVPQ